MMFSSLTRWKKSAKTKPFSRTQFTKAVVRPDYYTGTAMAEELSQLLTIIQAAEAGFYMADQSALDRLAESDYWIFDDSVPWISSTNGAECFAAKVRSQGIDEVLFLSNRSSTDAAGSRRSLASIRITDISRTRQRKRSSPSVSPWARPSLILAAMPGM
jgi:hypothetical protein